MPTRTEHIPCPTCGKVRPIAVRRPSVRVNAANRPCRTCARPPKKPARIASVPCPRCGTERPLMFRRESELTRALTRPCRHCGNHPDVDEMAVERLVIGQPVKANAAERREAVAYLTRRKLSAPEIARRIGCTQRTVERHRQRLARAITVQCPYCYQPIGEPCVIPRTGTELVHQPAHLQRIRAVTAGG